MPYECQMSHYGQFLWLRSGTVASTGHDHFIQVWFLNVLMHTKFLVKPSTGRCFTEGSILPIHTLYVERPKLTGGLTSLGNVCVCLGTRLPADVGLLLTEIFSLDRNVTLVHSHVFELVRRCLQQIPSEQYSGVQFGIYYCVKRTQLLIEGKG